MIKYIIALLLLLAAGFGYQQYNASVNSIENKNDQVISEALNVSERTDNYSIDINIEKTGILEIDTLIALQTQIDIQEFKTLAQQAASSADLVTAYSFERNSKKYNSSDPLQMESILITSSYFTGGPHENVNFESYTYSPVSGAQYEITNLVEQSPELEELIIERTIREMKAFDLSSEPDQDQIRSAVNQQDNLNTFYLQKDALVFVFETNLMGSHVDGPQFVEISMTDLLPHARGFVQKAYNYSQPANASTTETVN